MGPSELRAVEATQSFKLFLNLPVEIRLRVWAMSARLRPRVIQIYYERENETWRAWKDGCGGLPSTALVCRESFAEAVKPYTKIFDTYFHLKDDTLFVSDPLFTLRKPREILMSSAYVQCIRKIALTNEQLEGIDEMHEESPRVYPSATAILRRFKGLQRFTLVLSEDGAGDHEEGSDQWLSDVDEADDEEDFGEEHDTTSVNDNLELEHLENQETEAMDSMPKGYFRQVGNIHFQHATANADHWDSWQYYKEYLPSQFNEEKEAFPSWSRPNICIMVVRYGLNPSYQDIEIHIQGDYRDGTITEESSKYLQWAGMDI